MPLQLFGLAAFRAALSEKIWLARYFHRQLAARDNWELTTEPDLSVVTYRYRPARGDADAFNRRLASRVNEGGKVFISTTRLGGQFTLRLAVLNFRTHLEHIDHLLDRLDYSARAIETEGVADD